MNASRPPTDEAAVTSRVSFRYSADGRRAACLATDERGRQHAESWSLSDHGPRLDFSAELRCDHASTTVLPVDAERLLVTRHGAARSQTVDLLHRDGGSTRVGDVTGVPLVLLSAPQQTEAAGTEEPEADGSDCLALAWSNGDSPPEGRASEAEARPTAPQPTLYQVRDTAPWLRELTRLPGPVTDATVCGRRVLLTVGLASGPVRLLVDPQRPTTAQLPWAESADRADPPSHVLAATGRHVLLASRGPEGATVTLVDLDSGDSRRLDSGADLRGEVFPVAADPTGATVAVVETVGARSHLSRWDTRTGATHRIDLPEGELLPYAAWTAAGLWIPWSAPQLPRTFAWLPPDATRLRVPVPRTGAWLPGRVESFPGADGPVEAVVYGPDWRSCPLVVVVLHGGPTSRWTLGFEPLLQSLAAAGAAVVAPNQRGSTGYGARHTFAIVGAWGVPDLADITAVGEFIGRHRADAGRDRPAVCGVSYGGYLALLAAGTRPEAWSSCVAVAPFLSGPRLHHDARPPVRSMVRRLDGLNEASDALGPRDVERFGPGLRARLLLVHGAADASTPVQHSRALVRRLTALGRVEGRDFDYLEIPDRGHNALGRTVRDPVTAEVTRFLTAARTPAARSPAGRPHDPERR